MVNLLGLKLILYVSEILLRNILIEYLKKEYEAAGKECEDYWNWILCS